MADQEDEENDVCNQNAILKNMNKLQELLSTAYITNSVKITTKVYFICDHTVQCIQINNF